jgi:hypothetical protein
MAASKSSAESRALASERLDANGLEPETRDVLGARDAERALAAWREHDAAQALHGPDRDAIGASDVPRALVLELLARPGPVRDLYNACARLGRLLADAGASPSLAVATIDGAMRALSDLGFAVDAARLTPARASVAEGYFAVTSESERAAGRRTWEYPACAVRVAKDTVAIMAGYPADDGEALADWSARVAIAVSRDGYRQAIIGGPPTARAELGQALSLVGVELATSVESKGWLSSLLKR